MANYGRHMLFLFLLCSLHPLPALLFASSSCPFLSLTSPPSSSSSSKLCRRQDPSRDFVNVWQEIGQTRVYVPQKQDVGRILKLE